MMYNISPGGRHWDWQNADSHAVLDITSAAAAAATSTATEVVDAETMKPRLKTAFVKEHELRKLNGGANGSHTK